MIIVYIKTAIADEKWKFNSLATLLQSVFIFITLWITIYTIYTSSSDTEKLFENLNSSNSRLYEMKTSMDNVSEKLKEMPNKIEKFSVSIDSLNYIMYQQKTDFKKNTDALNNTIKNLSESVSKYESNIDNYSEQLNKIVGLTDQQLIIWKNQQRVLLDEFSRKPILVIYPKKIVKGDKILINDLIIENKGNIESNIRVIFLHIPINNFISLNSGSFLKHPPISTSELLGYKFSPLNTNIEIISAGSKIIMDCQIHLNNSTNYIIYSIEYYSKYYSGTTTDVLYIK